MHDARDSSGKASGGFRPAIILGLACMFYFYEFLLQISPSVMGVELMHDFNVTAHALGSLTALYFYPYAYTQLLVGVLVDRYGPRILLTMATLICALSSLVFVYATDIRVAGLARFFIGFGSAFAVVSAFKLAANWFSHNRFAMVTGIVIAIGMLGAISAETLFAVAVESIGWRQSMFYTGLAGLVLAVLIFFIVRDEPEGAAHPQTSNDQQAPLLEGMLHVLKNRRIWILAVYGGLMFFGTPTFCGLWGVPYLMEKYTISKTLAGGLTSLIFAGWAIGGPIAGWLSDRIGRRKPPMILGAFGALIMISMILYMRLPLVLLGSAMIAFGFFSSCFLPAFSVAREITNPRYTATGLGFMNMVNMVGIPFAQTFIGYFLDKLWAGEVAANGVRVYSQHSFELAMLMLPGALILAILLLPFIEETHCHQIAQNHD